MQQTKEPQPLLTEWSSQGATRSGFDLNVRPANPGDERLLVEFFGRVKPPYGR